MTRPSVTRRAVLVGAAVLGWAGLPRRAEAAAPQPAIHPRSDWARGIPAPRGLVPEDDVRFLLVHHSETPNTDARAAIPGRIRSIHDFHTGEKGWPDIAYNFFVDAYGGIWEGRAGSLAGPVRGDATGGSQGHALLCCFIGEHMKQPPTPAAQKAMASLLAWLAGRYGIDLTPGRTVRFTSRGSNRWPKGATVTTTPIAGHRDMSQTSCPGDAAYPLVKGSIALAAAALAGAPAATRGGAATTASPPTRAAAPTVSPSGAVPTTPTTPTSTAVTSPSSSVVAESPSATTAAAAQASGAPADGGAGGVGTVVGVGGAVGAVAAGSALVARHLKRERDHDSTETPSENP